MKPIYKLTAKVIFPEGVAPGMGSEANRQLIARNGKGEVLLRGSALAGVLRHTHAERIGRSPSDPEVSRWFGTALEGENGQDSPVQVADVVINKQTVTERSHNLINRHTGAAVDKGLFFIEAVLPGSGAEISITVDPNVGRPFSQVPKPEAPKDKAAETNHSGDAKEFISHLVDYLANGLWVGGNRNRGIGRMIVEGKLHLRSFDVREVDGMADFLNAQYKERQDGISLDGEPQESSSQFPDRLVIAVKLGIPRGEDFLVGDGLEADYVLRPQSAVFADGELHWRIPGSALRGIFRGWMTRLAARKILARKGANKDGQSAQNGQKILDSVERWDGQAVNSDTYNPNASAWGFVPIQERKQLQQAPHKLNDPIFDLFGSLYQKGRIHISDAFSETTPSDQATARMHVAVDRISGGAHEGALFQNQVLTESQLRFPFEVAVTRPKEEEVEWLIKTLKALHLGILLVGSSKGSGRLEVKSLSAQGPMSGRFNSFLQEVN